LCAGRESGVGAASDLLQFRHKLVLVSAHRGNVRRVLLSHNPWTVQLQQNASQISTIDPAIFSTLDNAPLAWSVAILRHRGSCL